jgi:hypothetical protein
MEMLVYYNKVIQWRDTMILILYQLLLPRILQTPQIVNLSMISENSKFNFAATHFHLLLCTSNINRRKNKSRVYKFLLSNMLSHV